MIMILITLKKVMTRKKMMKMKTLTKIIMVLTILKKPKRSREDASHEESREARGVSSNLVDMIN